MAVDATTLRTVFPEFASATTYPDAQITFWLDQAALLVTPQAFGPRADLATMLFVAHYISLSALNARAAQAGGVGAVGATLAPVSAKSVGPISKTYDIASVITEGAGPWNATSYGQQFYRLLRAAAAGPHYVPGRSRVMAPIGYGFGAPYPYGSGR